MTYLEWYVEQLNAQLEVGGTEAEVEHAVTEFNKPTRGGFEKYAADKAFNCATCGDLLIAASPLPPLDQEIACPKCAPLTTAKSS